MPLEIQNLTESKNSRMERPAQVLVVDDDKLAHEAYDAYLRREPVELVHVFSAAAGLEVLATRADGIDLILCDVMMPETDGYAFGRALRASQAPWRAVPLVLVTALSDVSDMLAGLEAGADEFLSKPVSGEVLRARVKAMLRMRDRYAVAQGAAGAGAAGAGPAGAPSPPTLESLLESRVAALAVSAGLTAREREVLSLLLLGRSFDEIGLVLSISARTAKFHQANVLQKLGVESRAALLRGIL